ncbi:MAG: hypothetical protein D6722_05575 [Bacteroidetes bacterium]|nr:MAG: hypothetical protein D6722_05575 [Bacteroidota bacterium]
MQDLYLINPGSGHKRKPEETESLIREAYRSAGRGVRVEPIDFARLDALIARAIAQGTEHIFAVGGDGTVNAIGTRLIGRPVHFGIIPHGSGNGYARNLGFSIRPRIAAQQALGAHPMRVDTGLFDGRPFLNVAGVGLDAEITRQFARGNSRGFVPYAVNSAQGLLSYRGADYRLTIDGENHDFTDILGVVIANGTQWGYDAKVSTEARLADGLLDLLVVRKFPLIKAGAMVGKMFRGRFHRSRYVEVFRFRELLIERAAPGPAQIDGEPLEAGARLSVKVQPASLSVLLPGTLTEAKIQTL